MKLNDGTNLIDDLTDNERVFILCDAIAAILRPRREVTRCAYCREVILDDEVGLDIMKSHLEACPEHPLAAAMVEIEELKKEVALLKEGFLLP